MSIDTINYLLSKYYDTLSNTQYLYQNELENPGNCVGEIEPKIKYQIEIDLMKRIIEQLEELKSNLESFSI